MAEERKRQKLGLIEKELSQEVVLLGDPRSSNVCSRLSVQESMPVASVIIQNKLYWLWKQKIDLLSSLNLSIPTYTQLLNDRIGGTVKASGSAVENRLCKESSRYFKL